MRKDKKKHDREDAHKIKSLIHYKTVQQQIKREEQEAYER